MLPVPTPQVEVPAMDIEISESVQCPFCGQLVQLIIDTGLAEQRFTTDCEVCCRPFEVFVECEPGAIVILEVQT